MISTGDSIKLQDGRVLVVIEDEGDMLKAQIDCKGDVYWLTKQRATQKIDNGEWRLM